VVTPYRSDTMARLEAADCILTNLHVVYKSGHHGPTYLNLDPAFADGYLMDVLGARLASPFRDQEIDVVVAPAVGGTALVIYVRAGFWVTGRLPHAVWADKVGSGFEFDRAGFAAAIRGKRVLVVEDILNRGTSVEAVCELVRQAGGIIMGISVICNRGEVTAERLQVPRLVTLVTQQDLSSLDLRTFPPHNCPLCQDQRPIVTNLGHGTEFRAKNPTYPGGFITKEPH
jgi:orotate phosphoribosyltransferase